jgi:hypothetical protein
MGSMNPRLARMSALDTALRRMLWSCPAPRELLLLIERMTAAHVAPRPVVRYGASDRPDRA